MKTLHKKNRTFLAYKCAPCNILKYKIAALLLLATIFGCDSFTEVDLPSSQLTATDVFRDKATATAAMTNIYTQIRTTGMLSGSPQGFSNQLGQYADELGFYSGPGSISFNFYNNALLPSGNEITDLWNNAYKQIYAANAVLEGIQGSDALAQADRDALRGEALFVRALLHFYIGNAYGEVPYITTTDYRANRVAPRLGDSRRHALLEQDLQEAIALLPTTDVSGQRTRPTKWASQALLARLYLYGGKWAEASNAASAVLNESGLFSFGGDPETTFLKTSPSTIWQLAPSVEGANTLEGATFIFVSAPPAATALSEDLLAAFEPGDLRRTAWVKAVSGTAGVFYHANKYKERLASGTSKEYSVIFRLAEMYLVRAEARAKQGEIIGAREDLNRIRAQAGLGETAALTPNELALAIEKERRIELFTEFGHRFFDLKRTDRLDAVLGAAKPGWDMSDRLLPLPQRELLLNPNLAPQNPGY